MRPPNRAHRNLRRHAPHHVTLYSDCWRWRITPPRESGPHVRIHYIIGDSAEPVMADNTHSDVKRLPFERAIEELESIVKRLEEGKGPLEESVAIYERGEALKRRCEELLRQAEARVEKITLDAAGKPTGTEPLDVT